VEETLINRLLDFSGVLYNFEINFTIGQKTFSPKNGVIILCNKDFNFTKFTKRDIRFFIFAGS
jgi:hypothetical protein